MRIDDLNSDWGLWFGLCTALLLIDALWKGKQNYCMFYVIMYQYYEILTTLTFT